ncbi:MAG: cyclic nucleotide-binding domain-containing protein [Planctomycetales bacterium]|nr:cyclic nucleotide-binding domain-containing protein [Planctomycetales bacterium]
MDGPLLHIANVLYLLSYSVRDIFWLRILTVTAMLCLSGCYVQSGEYTALMWQAAFLTINIGQIGLLIYERRPVQLNSAQRKLLEGPLSTMTPRQVKRFEQKADWRIYAVGETLLDEGRRSENLILLLSGQAEVHSGDRRIAVLNAGQFAGEMSFLTRGLTTARVTASQPVVCALWPERYVAELMEREQDLGTALQAALGIDLVKKLLNTREGIASAAS